MAIVFSNVGEIDPQSIISFGVSVKESTNPIGFFGTGLKYAIAICCRNEIPIKIFSGEREFNFKAIKKEVRGQEFSFIHMNDEPLSFTTELGKNWEPWQAFREIYCNALDEGGGVELVPVMNEPNLYPVKGETRIIVYGDVFSDLYRNRSQIVLNMPKNLKIDLKSDVGLEVFKSPSKHLFYRGIRVATLQKESMFTYNMTRFSELTEDRTLKTISDMKAIIPLAIGSMVDKKIIKRVMRANPESCYEGELQFSGLRWYEEVISEEFIEAMEELHANNDDACNRSALSFFKDFKDKKALKNYEPCELNSIQKTMLEKCKKILFDTGYNLERYEIVTVKSLGRSVRALADEENQSIVLSLQCFDRGTKYLLSTMLEEVIHLDTGFGDESRELQTYLFDKIVSLFEEFIVKEPI